MAPIHNIDNDIKEHVRHVSKFVIQRKHYSYVVSKDEQISTCEYLIHYRSEDSRAH